MNDVRTGIENELQEQVDRVLERWATENVLPASGESLTYMLIAQLRLIEQRLSQIANSLESIDDTIWNTRQDVVERRED